MDDLSSRPLTRLFRARATAGVAPAGTERSALLGLPRIMLRDAAPTPLTEREIYGGYCEGHVVLGGGTLVERRTSFALLGPDEEASRLDRLKEICANTWFASAPLILARMHDATVDLRLGFCVTSDGLLVDEATFVAGKIDPMLDLPPFQALTGDPATETTEVAELLLHCFHRSAGAFGHFVLDGLVTVERAREAILAGRVKVLVPPYVPHWAGAAMRAIGLPDEAFLRAGGLALRCRRLLLASSINASTSFRPDPALCGALRQRLAPGPAGERRIYLSGANQTSFSQCSAANEDEVRRFLIARRFESSYPAT